jgi:hypothetical protein
MGQKIGAIITVIVGLPLLMKFLFWSIGYSISPSTEGIGKGAELIADAAIPWWLGVIEWLAALPLAGLLVLGFILFLKWVGEI